MKQTLTEIAEILKEIERGKAWEFQCPELPADKTTLPLIMAATGYTIRLKPVEPDAEGWIPWSGGECPVDGCSVVEIKTGIGTVSKRTADALRWRWDWSGTGSDIVAYRIHKEPEPEYVTLGPGDVPPGSEFRHPISLPGISWTRLSTNSNGVIVSQNAGNDNAFVVQLSWKYLRDNMQINRSLPLTGKWDPQAWEPCRKLKNQDA